MYPEDMHEFCNSARACPAGHDAKSPGAEVMRLDATLRKLSLIGAAVTRVPGTHGALAPDIPWRKLVATRNRMIHADQDPEMSALWSIVSADVPALRLALQALLQRVWAVPEGGGLTQLVAGALLNLPSASGTPAPRAHAARGT